MVKKTSFLERLFKGRKAAASARPGQVGSLVSDKKDGPGQLGDKGSRLPASAVPTQPEKSNGSRGKRREEATVALTDGFKDLSQLLTGIKDRMDQQVTTAVDLNKKFVDLPDMAKAQVQFMTKISEQIAANKEKTGLLLDKLGGLPDLLAGIHKTLEKQATAEARSEKTLSDFRSTMNQIHQSIGTLSSENKAAMKQTTESFERTHSRTTKVFEESQSQAYRAFEKTQAAQIDQISKLVQRSGKTNGMLIFLLVVLVVSMVVMISVLVGR